jgi:hypothetical protein
MIISKVQRETKPAKAVASKASAPGKTTMQAPRAPQDMIRMQAYQIFASRGYEHGHDVQDWLSAERQIQVRAH